MTTVGLAKGRLRRFRGTILVVRQTLGRLLLLLLLLTLAPPPRGIPSTVLFQWRVLLVVDVDDVLLGGNGGMVRLTMVGIHSYSAND